VPRQTDYRHGGGAIGDYTIYTTLLRTSHIPRSSFLTTQTFQQKIHLNFRIKGSLQSPFSRNQKQVDRTFECDHPSRQGELSSHFRVLLDSPRIQQIPVLSILLLDPWKNCSPFIYKA
jgi:hypothetical protein